MSYNEILAERVRKLLSDYDGITERKMFGGLAFLLNGNMSVTVSGKGGILVRVNPDEYELFSTEAGVEMTVMRGKKMTGWLRVTEKQLERKDQLTTWLTRGIQYTKNLPAKK